MILEFPGNLVKSILPVPTIVHLLFLREILTRPSSSRSKITNHTNKIDFEYITFLL